MRIDRGRNTLISICLLIFMKNVWILEDDKRYREKLEDAVKGAGFSPVSFSARNPFLKSFFKMDDKSDVYAMILDNMVPPFDEAGSLARKNAGIGIIDKLGRRGVLGEMKIALYTSDEMNSEIERVCKTRAQYHCKNDGTSWIENFLNE